MKKSIAILFTIMLMFLGCSKLNEDRPDDLLGLGTGSETERFSLEVNAGSGSGDYEFGQSIDVIAHDSANYIFSHWSGDISFLVSVNSSATKILIPTNNLSITAVYLKETFELAVLHGTGAGKYTKDETIPVEATIPADHEFKTWTGDVQYLNSATSANAIVTMPTQPISIEATFSEIVLPSYLLTVEYGSGSGEYIAGEQKPIIANNKDGFHFVEWIGNTENIDNINSKSAVVTMPDSAITVTATYLENTVPTFPLMVVSGSGTGDYEAGTEVSVVARDSVGHTFSRWSGDIDYISSTTAMSITVTMPSVAVDIVAIYTVGEPTFRLNVVHGTGSGEFKAGSEQSIVANNKDGFRFTEWVGDVGNLNYADSKSAIVTMPDSAITLTATYQENIVPTFPLSVIAGSGTGDYEAGTAVTVVADDLIGFTFTEWTGDVSHLSSASTASVTVTMPSAGISIQANYIEDIVYRSITAQVVGANGSITPNGQFQVPDSTDTTFIFTADEGFEVDEVLVNGVAIATVTSYPMSNITGDSTISVSFKEKKIVVGTHRITPTVSGGMGDINPNNPRDITEGQGITFTLVPKAHYELDFIVVDNDTIRDSVDTYTFHNVMAPHTIKPYFKKIVRKLSITWIPTSSGMCSPGGTVDIYDGESRLINILPKSGYGVKTITVDGSQKPNSSSYFFDSVSKNSAMHVVFEEVGYTLSATGTGSGTITPADPVNVPIGGGQEFTFVPDEGYEVKRVTINGIDIPACSSYSFSEVSDDKAVVVEFVEKKFTVTRAVSSGNGSITNSTMTIGYGKGIAFSITPDIRNEIDMLTVNAVEVDPRTLFSFGDNYVLPSIKEDTDIRVSFKPIVQSLMKFVARGSYNMGTELLGEDAKPEHQVTFYNDIYVDSTEVTQEDFIAMYTHLSYGYPEHPAPTFEISGADYPVYGKTWFDAVLYCNARSKYEGFDTVYTYTSIEGTPGNGCTLTGLKIEDYTKSGFRLPTEGEWEFFARAGGKFAYYWGDDEADADRFAWHSGNSQNAIQSVAQLSPNSLGLYDISGNVWEMCNDGYDADYYKEFASGAISDPKGLFNPPFGTDRVIRGGSYRSTVTTTDSLKMGHRFYLTETNTHSGTGFRAIREIPR